MFSTFSRVLVTATLCLTASNLFAMDEAVKNSIRQEMDKIFLDEKFDHTLWGVRVESLDGEVLYDLNGNKGFMPASTMKLFTTAAALDILGSDYRYETTVKAVGYIVDGTLHGDLVIVGSGDPTLGGWNVVEGEDSRQLFADWISKIREAGIERIDGNIVGDGRIFTEEYLNGSWNYSDLPYWYAAGSSGLVIEENGFRSLYFPAKEVGGQPTFEINPKTDYVTIINEATTGPAGSKSNMDYTWRQTEGNTFRLSRSIALDKESMKERSSIWDGNRYGAYLFQEALKREGIDVTGDAVNAHNYDRINALDQSLSVKEIAVTVSPPMSTICDVINKISHNLYADQVVRTLGVEERSEGSFEAGTSVVKDWLKEIGLPAAEAFRMEDGSGLAYSNVVQPEQMTALLRLRHTDEVFVNSVALRDRGEGAKGVLRAKTGYIGLARNFGGYITTEGGEELVFSMMGNLYSVSTSEIANAENNACDWLAALE